MSTGPYEQKLLGKQEDDRPLQRGGAAVGLNDDDQAEPAKNKLAEALAAAVPEVADEVGYQRKLINPTTGEPINPSKKTHCTYWIRTGTCGFNNATVPCRFKHEMPEEEDLKKFGLNYTPKWWKDQQKRRVGAAVRPQAAGRGHGQHQDVQYSSFAPSRRVPTGQGLAASRRGILTQEDLGHLFGAPHFGPRSANPRGTTQVVGLLKNAPAQTGASVKEAPSSVGEPAPQGERRVPAPLKMIGSTRKSKPVKEDDQVKPAEAVGAPDTQSPPESGLKQGNVADIEPAYGRLENVPKPTSPHRKGPLSPTPPVEPRPDPADARGETAPLASDSARHQFYEREAESRPLNSPAPSVTLDAGGQHVARLRPKPRFRRPGDQPAPSRLPEPEPEPTPALISFGRFHAMVSDGPAEGELGSQPAKVSIAPEADDEEGEKAEEQGAGGAEVEEEKAD